MSDDQQITKDTDDRSPHSDRDERNGWLQIILVIAVLFAGVAANLLLSSGSSDPEMRTMGDDALLVDVVAPVIEDTRVRIVETGVVQARNSIALSPQVSGRVVWVSSDLASGGSFLAGESLFRLDDADYAGAVERARADVANAQADLELELAEAAVARQEWALVNPGEPIPPLVARAPQISQAEARLQSARAALLDAQLDLARVDFSLPFDGRIVSTTIEVGQNLSAGQSYGNAYDTRSLEISTPLNADALFAIGPAVGRSAQVRLPVRRQDQQAAPTYAATIVRADAELDAETRLGRVILTFDEPTPLLPGAFTEVTIEGPVIEQAHLIPERAISQNRTVWVADDGRLAARRPRLYFVKDGNMVTDPFDWSDGVIVTPLVDPAEGAPVLVNDGPGEAS